MLDTVDLHRRNYSSALMRLEAIENFRRGLLMATLLARDAGVSGTKTC